MKPLKSIVGDGLLAAVLLWPAVNDALATSRKIRELSEIRQLPTVCSEGDTIKNLWRVEHLNVTYTTDELVGRSNASFTITSLGTTQRLVCTLRANYVCEMKETLGYPGLYIWLQINVGVASFSLDQSLSCGTVPGYVSCVPHLRISCIVQLYHDHAVADDSMPHPNRSAHAIGTALLYLTCPRIEEDSSCYSDDNDDGFADGLVTLPSPSL